MMRKTMTYLLLALLLSGCSGLLGLTSQDGDTVEREGEPDVVIVESEDEEMNAAIQQAQDMLDVFTESLESPQPSQVYFSIKAKLPYGGDEASYEHIWLDEISYDGDLFTGRLSNVPLYVEDLKLGDKVSVATDDVSDWMIVDEDGRLTGGYTLRVLRNRMSPEEQEQFDKESGLIIED